MRNTMRHYKSSPRDRPVEEFIGLVQVFSPNARPKQKGFNRTLADLLTKQIMERRFDMEEIKRVAPNAMYSLFYEVPCDYGVRMGNQLEVVVERLREDKDSRRAIIVMGRPDDEVPCCIQTIQFFIRERELITVVHMRSWDIGLGLAYDLDTFAKLSKHVAGQLNVRQGNIVVFAGSGHLYTKEEP